MKITIAQLNPIVGDIEGNLKKIINVLTDSSAGSDLVVFPELFLTGYPPRDLLERSQFRERVQSAVDELVNVSNKYSDTGVLLGVPTLTGKDEGRGLYNSAILIYRGQITETLNKSLLPSYDVFDETRYFDPAPEIKNISFKGQKLGVSICEDMWNNPHLWPQSPYVFDPIDQLAENGASVLINISASPFYAGKEDMRYRLTQDHASKHRIPFLFVNQVGSNDELIFDGRSMFVDENGIPVSVFPAFREHVETIDTGSTGKMDIYVRLDEIESVHEALVLGAGDYVKKCGFSKIVVGLSGGIDSAVTCVLAKEAVGGKNVLGISMPSQYSADESTEYSRILANNLGVEFKVIPISRIYASYIEALEKDLKIKMDEDVGVYLQNIQARIRGNILMAFSNKHGSILFTTGNKSEIAVGYCTLYGDMAGGLAVISDVPKTMVYKLAEYINREKEVIPRQIIDRAPSAELKPGQLDQDTLPPYEILDEMLHCFLEEGYSVKKMLEKGFKEDTVKWIINSVSKNEYKRKQAPPGLKVTTKAFGVGRRMPIASVHDVL